MATFEVLDELMEINGSTELHKRMRFWFVQEIAEEEGLLKFLRDQCGELRRKNARHRVFICEMEDLGERGVASNPKTLDEAFSLARAAETRFTNLDIWEFLRSNLSTLGEDFFKARIIEAYFRSIAEKEQNIPEKEDTTLSLPTEEVSPVVEWTLDASKDTILSSALNVAPLEVVFAGPDDEESTSGKTIVDEFVGIKQNEPMDFNEGKSLNLVVVANDVGNNGFSTMDHQWQGDLFAIGGAATRLKWCLIPILSLTGLYQLNHQDAMEKLAQQQAAAFQAMFDTLRAELPATRGLLQNRQAGGDDQVALLPRSMWWTFLNFQESIHKDGSFPLMNTSHCLILTLINVYGLWDLTWKRKLLVSKPTTFGDMFSLAQIIDACFDDQAAQVAASELEMRVLVDGKQDESKVMDVADEQNNNELDVLEVNDIDFRYVWVVGKKSGLNGLWWECRRKKGLTGTNRAIRKQQKMKGDVARITTKITVVTHNRASETKRVTTMVNYTLGPQGPPRSRIQSLVLKIDGNGPRSGHFGACLVPSLFLRSNPTCNGVSGPHGKEALPSTVDGHHRATHRRTQIELCGRVDISDMVDMDLFTVVALNMMVLKLGYTGESEPMFYNYLIPFTIIDVGMYALACEEDVRCLATLVRSFKLIKVYIEHGVTVLDSYLRSPQFRATLEDITDEPACSIAANRTEKMLLLTWHESSKTTKEPVCGYIIPRSLPHDSSTPCKDSVCESITPMCMSDCILTPPTNESIITYTQLSGTHGVDTQSHVLPTIQSQFSDINLSFVSQQATTSQEPDAGPTQEPILAEVSTQEPIVAEVSTQEPIVAEVNTEATIMEEVGTHEFSVEDVVIEDYVSSGEDAKHGTDDDDDVNEDFLVDEENEIVEPDVDVYLFGISMDLPFDNIGITNLVPYDVLEGEDVDVIDTDGFDSDPVNDEERNYKKRRLAELRTEMKGVINASGQWKYSFYTGHKFTSPKGAKDRVLDQLDHLVEWKLGLVDQVAQLLRVKKEEYRVNPDILVKEVQDQLQRELEVQISMSKAFKDKAKAAKEIRGDHVSQYYILRECVVELHSTNPNTTVKIAVERNTDPSSPTRVFQIIYVMDLHPNLNFTFISDRQKGWCGQAYKDLLWRAASATNVRDFERCMLELKTMNPRAHEWLNKIPAEHWARSYFSGVIDKCTGPLTPTVTIIMESIKKEAHLMKVQWNGENKYQVSGSLGDQCVVDVVSMTCSCRKWKLTGTPYKHAIAACWNMALNDRPTPPLETWVNPCNWLSTWKETYSHKIQPICETNYWEKSTCPTILLPPKHHVQVGQPKKKIKRSKHEDEPFVKDGKLSKKGRTITCQSCRNIGHNKTTCKGQGGNNAEGSGSASRQAQQTEHEVGQDGSGGSGASAVIGLSAGGGKGGASDPGGADVDNQVVIDNRKFMIVDEEDLIFKKISPMAEEILEMLRVCVAKKRRKDENIMKYQSRSYDKRICKPILWLGGGDLRDYVSIVGGTDDEDSDSELLIPTPWSDESKNDKRAKGWREDFERKRFLFEIDFTFGINAFDLYKGTDVMKDTVSQKNVGKRMDANVPDGIDGAKGEHVPNHVVKKGNIELLVCKEVANPGVNELVNKGRPPKRKEVYAEKMGMSMKIMGRLCAIFYY
nr:hypothetical protein [Tanacetum cinerariifolium]